MKARSTPVLVAIVGGSGAGKSWLAEKVADQLGREASRVSLDDFYRDRSHLPEARRTRINFDHPRAIDWKAVEGVLRNLRAGRSARLPCYNFATHCRKRRVRTLKPTPVILFEGLWLLRRADLRRLFTLRIFLECPVSTRLQRRLKRDVQSRGRTPRAVREQFLGTVEPMHARYVEPQKRWADVVLCRVTERDVTRLVDQLRAMVHQPETPR